MCFSRPSSNGVFSLVQEVTYKVPDRETGLQTLAELKGLCPNRKWNFVEVSAKVHLKTVIFFLNFVFR